MAKRTLVRFPNTIPIRETTHLTLRAVTLDDRAAVFALLADPRVAHTHAHCPFSRRWTR